MKDPNSGKRVKMEVRVDLGSAWDQMDLSKEYGNYPKCCIYHYLNSWNKDKPEARDDYEARTIIWVLCPTCVEVIGKVGMDRYVGEYSLLMKYGTSEGKYVEAMGTFIPLEYINIESRFMIFTRKRIESALSDFYSNTSLKGGDADNEDE